MDMKKKIGREKKKNYNYINYNYNITFDRLKRFNLKNVKKKEKKNQIVRRTKSAVIKFEKFHGN